MKKVVRIALRLKRFNAEALDLKAQSIIKSMTDNANFPSPVAELTAATEALRDYQQALLGAERGTTDDTARKNEKRAALEHALRVLAGYVEAKSNNDLSVLLSSGFEARKDNGRAGRLPKPADLRVTPTEKPGSVKVTVEKVPNAASYIFQYALAPVADNVAWQSLTGTARAKTIDGLEAGKQYAFRVAGVGADPVLVYSDEVTRFVA